MKICFTVNSLDISVESLPDIVDNSVNFLEASFSFNGNEWTETTVITAIFKSSASAYSVLLNNGKCIVPAEVLREESFKVGLSGSKIDKGLLKTFYTSEIVVNSKPSCFSHIYSNSMITPSQYDQLIAFVNENIAKKDFKYFVDSVNTDVTATLSNNTEYRFIPYSVSTNFSNSIGVTDAQINAKMFYDSVGGVPYGTPAEYILSYNGSTWECGDTINTDDLSVYGITLVGTPLENDILVITLNIALNTLNLSFDAFENNEFSAWIVFISGITPCSMTYPDNIKWSGDGVTEGVFVPKPNMVYNIGFWYDGFYVNGVVRGVDF